MSAPTQLHQVEPRATPQIQQIERTAALQEGYAEQIFARYSRRSAIQRFTRFLQECLRLSDVPLVIFLDEVESFLKMPGPAADGFLTAIRAYVNERDHTPLYRRLTFCLMGVCTPTELIQDERRTPFNVARGIPLEDFDWESVRAGFLPLFPSSSECVFVKRSSRRTNSTFRAALCART